MSYKRYQISDSSRKAANAKPRKRLRFPERRELIVDAACEVFASRSFERASISDLAAAAGVNRALLYQHFPSKTMIYKACVEHAWNDLRARWEQGIAEESDPTMWLMHMGKAFIDPAPDSLVLGRLWVQASDVAARDSSVAEFLRTILGAVHLYVAGVVRRSQAAGGVRPGLDPNAESWIFIATGLLVSTGRSLCGLVDADMPSLLASRRVWLYEFAE